MVCNLVRSIESRHLYNFVSDRLMLGFMMVSMLLSLWISNSGVTAMLIPIVDAVVDELFQVFDSISFDRFTQNKSSSKYQDTKDLELGINCITSLPGHPATLHEKEQPTERR